MLSDDEQRVWRELERRLRDTTPDAASFDADASRLEPRSCRGVPPRSDTAHRAGLDDAVRAGRGGAPIVVAIDGTGSAGSAVDWASAEAAALGCPLRIVHAFRLPLPPDPFGVILWADVVGPARAVAESVVQDAVARVRAIAADVEVSARLLSGVPTRALRDETPGARLLVVGSRPLCGLRRLVHRSVSADVAAHSCCPVVVVRPHPDVRGGTGPAPVVVGVDSTPNCSAAVGFAFRAARRRGLPVVAVHAWAPDRAAGPDGVRGPSALAEECARRALENALDRWRPEFDDVPVAPCLVRGDPAHALLAQDRGAALLVLGSRGGGGVRTTALGSVGRSVLHRGKSPLAIIRHDAASSARLSGPTLQRDQESDPDRDPRRRRDPHGPPWPS